MNNLIIKRKKYQTNCYKFRIIKRYPSGLVGTATRFAKNSPQIARSFATVAKRTGLVEKFHTAFGVNISPESGALGHHTLVQGASSATLTSNPEPKEADGTIIPTFRLGPTKYVQDGSLSSQNSQFVVFRRYAEYNLRNQDKQTFQQISDPDEALLAHLLDLHNNHPQEFAKLEHEVANLEKTSLKMGLSDRTISILARVTSENFVKSIYVDYIP